MLKVSQLMRVDVYEPKRKSAGNPADLGKGNLTVIGAVHQVVFTPDGTRVVGLLARRPDVGGMIRRPDAFVALDSIVVGQLGLVITRGEESLDETARARLGLDWDACIIWTGMDAKTTDGKELGWVSDVEFSPKSGKVKAFYVGDGSVAKSLVGNVVIPVDMLRGYKDGFMLVDPAAAMLALDGGLAARAGEGYAKARQGGKQAAERAGKVAGEAMEKGAYGLGKMIGKAKRAVAADDEEKPTPEATSDASEKDAAKKDTAKKKSTKKGAANAVGKQLKRTRGMFGSFMDEYKKASK